MREKFLNMVNGHFVLHLQKGMDVEKRQLDSNRWKNYLGIEEKEYNLYVENVEMNTLQIEESN